MPEPKQQRLAVIAGVRTPFCKAGTEFAGLPSDDLGRAITDTLLTSTGVDPATIDEVIFGCVCQPADTANIARVIALRAGVPAAVPAVTVHRNCASGFEAITTAYERMLAGRGSLFLVGGVDSMSQVPLLYRQSAVAKFTSLGKARSPQQKAAALAAFRPEDFSPRIGLKLGLTDPVCGLNMGETAEILARELGISRDAQDSFAVRSHERALDASQRLADEIGPVYVTKNGGTAVMADNGPRFGQSREILGGLKPVFDKYGSVTAGNSSQITDGAAALLIMSEEKANELGLRPRARFVNFSLAGADPRMMLTAPIPATEKVLARAGMSINDIDLVEINEAFASVVLAWEKELHPDMERVNPNGGAIALGHPLGASGARLMVTLLNELERTGGRYGLQTMCEGGGMANATIIERL